MNAGIPDAVKRLSVLFPYGDLAATEAMFDRHPNQIAAVILEAARDRDPPPGYLAGLRRCATNTARCSSLTK
jgi:glutamate-1-semialdehyde 2,1-aminomutase